MRRCFDGLADAGDLVGRQIVHDDDIARPQGRRQHLFAPGEEDLAIHRPVEQHRRDEAGRVNPPTKVMVFQCPCGTAARQRWPFGAQPRRRAILVESPLSSMKIRLSGSSSAWSRKPSLACRLYIGTLLLAGMGGLFLCVMSRRSRNFQTAVVRPSRRARRQAASPSPRASCRACLCSQPQDEVLMRIEHRALRLALLGRPNVALRSASAAPRSPPSHFPIENRAAA